MNLLKYICEVIFPAPKEAGRERDGELLEKIRAGYVTPAKHEERLREVGKYRF